MMKISDNIKLSQKRNFMILLYNLSLNVKELNCIDNIIYGDLSYDLATNIYNIIPLDPTYKYSNQQYLRNYCDKYVSDMLFTERKFYIVLDTANVFLDMDNKYIASPSLPVLNVNASDLIYWYKLLSQGNGINNLLITSVDFVSGIHTTEYADYPTEKNNWSDKPIYECFTW